MTSAVPVGILPVIRSASAREALVIARGLIEAGVDGLEVTFTVPAAQDVIRELSTSGIALGAGTVRTLEQCEAAAEAGAAFVVAPDLDPAVVQRAHELGMAAVPGALTPGEVGRCLAAGADAVKLFPVGSVGGAAYVRSLSEPFPGVHWVVSGGIAAHDVSDYRRAGVRTICMGGALIDRAAAAAGDSDGVARYAARVLSGLTEAEHPA